MVSLLSKIVLCFVNTLFTKERAIIQPFSTTLVAKILLRHRTKTGLENIIVTYVCTLIVCWGHFSASLVAGRLKRHKSNVTRVLKKNLHLHNLWHILTKRVLENSGGKSWLIIDSTIKGKRGKKLCNLQKFKTAHGYTVGHCFVFALLICEDGSEHIVAVKPYFTKKFCKRAKKEFRTQNQLAVEILQEIQTPLPTHLTVVADSAFLADFVVDEIRRHPQWSFVSSLDSNRKITVKGYTSHARSFGSRHLPDLRLMSISCNGRKHVLYTMSTNAEISKVGESTVVVSRRGRQTLQLAGVGKKLSCREICYAYLLRWKIEVLFKELKQYLHFGSYRFRELEAYMNHIMLVILAHAMLKHLYPGHTVAEAKKLAYESSQKEFLHELRHDLTKFNGNKIVKNKILQAIPATTPSLPLSRAA